MTNKETMPLGLMVIKAETMYIGETLLFPYSFAVSEAITDILTIISKLAELYPQDENKILETHNLVFSSMEDFQNALLLHEALNEEPDSTLTIKRQAETHTDLWKMHHELYSLLEFYSRQAAKDSNSNLLGDVIENIASVLDEEYE